MRALLIAVALALPAGASAAVASPRPVAKTRVVVLPPAVEGELPDARRDELSGTLRAGLARGDFEVVPAPPDAVGCATPTCASEAAQAAGADYAVSMSVAVDQRDYTFVLELFGAESGERAARTEARCELCGIAEAREVVDGQAAALRDRLQALELEAPTLSFSSTPPGALIRLDGKVVGETPFERTVQPGSHRAEADKPGYVAETQEFEAVAGVHSTIGFELDPIPRSVRFRRLRAFGWAALGIGAASITTGITLIAIDGKPNTVDCEGDNVDPRGNCKFVYATGEAGIAVTVVGVALVGTGIGIAVGTRDRDKTDKQARLSLSANGVRLSGRF